MALDPRKRQKQIERRNAKQKARKKALIRKETQSLATRLQRTSVAPILHCCAAETLWEQGLGTVLLSRELHTGNVAFAAFLVDAYCLGVKNVACDVVPRGQYDVPVYEKLLETDGVRKLKPQFARALVEGAVDYAANLGFPPHADYEIARHIFGDIDASGSTEVFRYGREGRPFFFAGPHDGIDRCREIIQQLTARCGPDGFDFAMPYLSDAPSHRDLPDQADAASDGILYIT